MERLLDTGILREIADRLLAIQKHNTASTTEGFTEPVTILADSVLPNGRAFDVPKKFWFSVTITNDGPAEAQVIVVTQKLYDESPKPLTQWVTIKPGENTSVGFSAGQIKYLLTRTLAGTASLRVVGTR
jgi:hypothetical protein